MDRMLDRSQKVQTHVRVSPEMRALFHALRASTGASACNSGARPSSGIGPIMERRPSASSGLGSAAPGCVAEARTIRLRRDGLRPIVFRGAPLVVRETTGQLARSARDEPLADANSSARHRVAVFVAADGRLFAQIASKPVQQDQVRPVHTAAEIREQRDLEGMTRSHASRFGLPVEVHGPPTGPMSEGAPYGTPAECLERLVKAALSGIPLADDHYSGEEI